MEPIQLKCVIWVCRADNTGTFRAALTMSINSVIAEAEDANRRGIRFYLAAQLVTLAIVVAATRVLAAPSTFFPVLTVKEDSARPATAAHTANRVPSNRSAPGPH